MSALIEGGTLSLHLHDHSGARWWLRRLMKRLPLILGLGGLLSAIAVTVALQLPAVYQAQTQITVAASQIPQNQRADSQAPSALEQLQLFESRLLTRANLLDIARRLDVFAGQASMSPDEIVAAMRKATKITSVSGRDQATLMTISFDARRPDLAAGVVNAYLTVMLKDDVSLRTEQAKAAVDFFQHEVSRLGAAQDAQGAKILAFKDAHSDALPENLGYMRDHLVTLQRQLTLAEAEGAQLADQQARLVQSFATAGQVNYNQSPEQQKLTAARTALQQAEAVYSARNPRVQMLKAQVAVLEQAVAAQRKAGDGVDASSPAATLIKLQLDDVKSRQATLAGQRADLRKRIAALEAGITAVPANALVLSGLERDQSALQSQYAAAQKNLDAARQAAQVAAQSRGQRISVLQQPSVPTDPIRPRRGLIALAGIAGGLAGGLALAVALEALDRRLRRGEDLVHHLGITPLAVLPRITTRRERIARQSRRMLAMVAAAGCAALGMLALTQSWLPVAQMMRLFAVPGV
ncbi:MAG: hypothetical protein KGI94_10875 [Paracoccaceae bacterium]|nr:hypothetical protein [Paracoccaceae bacterium]